MTAVPSRPVRAGVVWPETRPEPRPWPAPAGPDAAEFLAVLRAEFPGVAFTADAAAGRWFAVRGKNFFVRAANGIELRDRLISAGMRPREVNR
ncbi:hypothetical protein [Actinomadura hibisca]|uniref:hypothetical protein n=1 Tax=Actinomadura hibisca TaxID=68565 RepID=UPI000834B342|nr:hypothetical protein [Actinomadura hibisca]